MLIISNGVAGSKLSTRDQVGLGQMDKKMNAIQILEEQAGFDVIDALVQANVDLESVTLEQVKQLLVRANRQRRDHGTDEIRLHLS